MKIRRGGLIIVKTSVLGLDGMARMGIEFSIHSIMKLFVICFILTFCKKLIPHKEPSYLMQAHYFLSRMSI